MSDHNHIPSTISTWWKQNHEKQLLDQLRRADAARLPPEPVTLGDSHAAPFLLATMQGYLIGLSGRQCVANPYHESPSLDREYLVTCWEKGIRQGREHRARELESRDPPATLTKNQLDAAAVRMGVDVSFSSP